ncbi:MAG: glutamate--tRNA ligase [Anaerolineales bacterium]|nr:glutamate--tRNA ligase [Anaerolineales bacterium]MDW8161926.1 glutamate--tRNA ligase [Anaerolineales bacterium]
MAEKLPPVRVRFAPSPTGRTHLGSGRTALYNYLLARQTGGQFILRIEDTDQKRYVPEAEQELIESLRWLGLQWDEGPDVGGPYGPYRQSERKEIYLEYAKQLIARDKAYYCFCTPERLARLREQQIQNKQPTMYDGLCRRLTPEDALRRIKQGEPYVIRFKTPKEGLITVRDYLRGEITVENRTIDDYILVKSDGWAVYHLAAMVDDQLMRITHVLRSSEWLSTFPLHAHIIRAFGWQEPVFVHLSVFLKPSGKGKMSKRDSAQLLQDGYSIYIKDLEQLGYLPEAVVNWIALMGWSYDDKTEFFTMQDLIEKFSLDHLNPSPAAINFTKFDHFNGLHIRHLSVEDLARRIKPFLVRAGFEVDDQKLLQITPVIQERLVTLDDAVELAGFFFREHLEYEPTLLIGKDMTAAQSLKALQESYQLLSGLDFNDKEHLEAALRSLAEQMGIKAGQLFGILRIAVTGKSVSPPLIESMIILGKEKVMEWLQTAIKRLATLVQANA